MDVLFEVPGLSVFQVVINGVCETAPALIKKKNAEMHDNVENGKTFMSNSFDNEGSYIQIL